MNAEKIIYAVNNIKDDYIDEYAEKEYRQTCRFRPWGIVAASLTIVIICTPILIHIFNPSGTDEPLSGVRYMFSSYSELCSVLPEGNIIAYIPDSSSAEISAFAECPEDTVDFTDYRNYSYLNINVSYNDGTGINIFTVIKNKKTAKEDTDSKPLMFPPGKTSVATISGCDIYYTYHDKGTEKISIAEFSLDGSLYKFTSSDFSNEELIQYISDMLNP